MRQMILRCVFCGRTIRGPVLNKKAAAMELLDRSMGISEYGHSEVCMTRWPEDCQKPAFQVLSLSEPS